MPDTREVFEMVTKQTEPDLDSWKEQERRHRKAARDRKLGAFGVAAVIAIVTLVIGVQIANNEPRPGPAITPTPPVETGSDLYVVDPETGETTLLLAARGNQTNPERSPDGTRVVYQSKVAGSPPQIFVLEADGTERQLTALERGAADPTWSPDGRQIAFAGSGSDADIFVMNADGSGIRRLAGTPELDSHPDWSPDGTRIAFQSGSNRSPCNGPAFSDCESGASDSSDIWVASVPDGIPTRLTNGADPAWSPDGRWIATSVFLTCCPLNGEIPYAFLRLVGPDGTKDHVLGDASPYYYWRLNPSWSPDGRSIVFEVVDVDLEIPLDPPINDRIGIIDVDSGEDSYRRLHTVFTVPASPSWGIDGILVSKQG